MPFTPEPEDTATRGAAACAGALPPAGAAATGGRSALGDALFCPPISDCTVSSSVSAFACSSRYTRISAPDCARASSCLAIAAKRATEVGSPRRAMALLLSMAATDTGERPPSPPPCPARPCSAVAISRAPALSSVTICVAAESRSIWRTSSRMRRRLSA